MRRWLCASLAAFALVVGVLVAPATAQDVTWVRRVPTGYGLGIDVLGGTIYVAGNLHHKANLRAYAFDGELRWARTVSDDEAYEVAAGPKGVFVVGSTGGPLAGQHDGRGRDAFVARYTTDGRRVWVRQISWPMAVRPRECQGEDMACPDSEEAFGVAVRGSGVYVVGRAQTEMPGARPRDEGFILRYDLDGVRRWIRTFHQQGWDVATGPSGVYVASFLEPQVRRYFPDGTLAWVRGGAHARATYDGIDVHGRAVYLAGGWGGNAVVRSLHFDGTQRWTTPISDRSIQSLYDVVVRGSRVFVVGTTHGRLPHQPLAGGDWDLLIAELDRDGTIEWISQIGGPRGEQGRGIAIGGGALFVASGTAGPFLHLPSKPPSMLVLRLNV